jgi:signal transduction histidine kinase
MKVLVVDDELVSRKTLQRLIAQFYECEAVPSGEEALEKAQGEYPPDLILLDVLMPGIDGFEVCRRLKAAPRTRDIPVIFLSAMTGIEDITRGFEVGAVDYITKPFNKEEVKARAQTHLSLKQMREDLQAKNTLLERSLKELEEKTETVRQRDAQLLMMDRIAGIGTLAAGIAHEINNPLGFVKSSVAALKKSCDKMIEVFAPLEQKPLEESRPEDLSAPGADLGLAELTGGLEQKFGRIERGIERIGKIVGSLRSFSRVDRENEGTLDINASLEEAAAILSSDEKPIRFEKDFTEIPPLPCTPNEINQSLLHLLKNALDAVAPGGVVSIQTAYDQEKNRLGLRISDNGCGMSAEVRRQAFDPFFTTKPVGSGTGVGLTIVEHIIKKHQGDIELTSVEGKGTTVSVYLPVRV